MDFYRALPEGISFAEAANAGTHVDLPPDWWIVVADVADSTRAIEAGAYKAVNTVGAACIAAVTNVDRAVELPFVFGGDGATFAVPDALRLRTAAALRATQRLAREGFGLTLRAGMMPTEALAAIGHPCRLGKLRLSPHATQPVLSGSGWAEAERRIKLGVAATLIDEHDGEPDGSFEGFECRWQGVPSINGHKLALLVLATESGVERNRATYGEVLSRIYGIYGDVAHHHPLRADLLKPAFDPRLLAHEWRVHGTGKKLRMRMAGFARILGLNLAACYLFARGIDTAAVSWSRYRDELVENSDFRKFDGTLRMVIDGSDAQYEELASWLETEFRAGRLAYGMHRSREALVTCLVHSHNGNHMHFVDGGDGGYALAAKELKRRLREREANAEAAAAALR